MHAPKWMESAACLPYPDFTEWRAQRQRRVCKVCPLAVKIACLAWATDYEADGHGPDGDYDGWPIYAGMTVKERAQLRLRRTRRAGSPLANHLVRWENGSGPEALERPEAGPTNSTQPRGGHLTW